MRHAPVAAIVLVLACSHSSAAPAPAPAPVAAPAPAPPPAPAKTWIERSNENAQLLVALQAKFAPEMASRFGVPGVDDQISDFTPGHRERLREAERGAQAELERRLGEMQKIATQLAKERGWKRSDYRDVIKQLKKTQIPDDQVLEFYKKRLAEIEDIIRTKHLVTLPDRPARIRIGTPAENAQQPAPHMVPPRLIGNTGEQGEFVLPLSVPGKTTQKYDDFNYDAATWTLIAHEARPGHELQFSRMIENGVSLARALFAFNSVNVEGWGLYSEAITLPYMPLDGQLISLQLRLQRAARAFLDPELQIPGKWTPAQARAFLQHEVGLSAAFATEEVDRFTFRAPGQATAYFYGYSKLTELRAAAEQQLGVKFDAQKFHDLILAQGLLPPDLMRKAVLSQLQ